MTKFERGLRQGLRRFSHSQKEKWRVRDVLLLNQLASKHGVAVIGLLVAFFTTSFMATAFALCAGMGCVLIKLRFIAWTRRLAEDEAAQAHERHQELLNELRFQTKSDIPTTEARMALKTALTIHLLKEFTVPGLKLDPLANATYRAMYDKIV